MSSELEYLIRNLKDLKESKDCCESIKQILSIFENLTEFTYVDQYLATLFVPGNDEDDGLVGFLRTKNGDKEFEKATYEGLTLIKWILDNRRSEFVTNVVHFIFMLKDICKILCLSHLGSSRVKVLSLECLITLLDTNIHSIRNDEISRNNLSIADLYWKVLPTTEETKQSATVRGKMFHLLGLLAHLGHNHFMNSKDKITQLFNHLINQINKQVTSHYSKLEVNIVHGCIKGMDYFLLSYNENDILKQSNNQNGNWIILYDNLFKIIDPSCSISYADEKDRSKNKLKRREFQRAGLELFANHGLMFRKNFLEHHKQWYADFLAWSISSNSDDSRVGNRAMNSLIKSITSYSEDRNTGIIDDNAKILLEKAANFFITTFRRILNNKESSRGEMNIAVKGIGLVSSICSDPTEKDSLYGKLINQIEAVIIELSVPITDKYSGSFLLIPTYIESVGEMLFSYFHISDEDSLKTFQERLAVVEQLVTLLITFYPDFGRAKLTSPFSVVKLAESIYKKHNKYFLPFFENVFNDALTQIIASPTKLEADILNAAAMSQVQENPKGNQKPNYVKTIHSYVPLFQFMMNCEEYLKQGNEENRKVISSLYDIILQWILNTIEKLDLTIEFIEDDLELATDGEEPVVNTKPKMLRDFQLFINLVEFFQEFVNETDNKLMESWIKIYLLEMLKFINQNPLVSGFYKIFSKVLEVSRKVNYFQDKDCDKDKEQLFDSCCDFFKSLTYKIHEYRDDLLISVLDIWLSAPNEFILKSENISSLEVTLQAIFRNGKNYFPLAGRGIEAIERWFLIKDDQQKCENGHKPLEEFENLFRNLFPIFKSYFTSVGETSIEKKPVADDKKRSKSRKNFGLRQRRIIQSELKDLDLKQLQLKILRLIGSFGNLLNINEEAEKICFSFDDEKFLKFAVPFADIKPDIYLDNFLPRVLDICQNSSDRQLRSASCEFLHSVVLYFLGSSQRQAGTSGSREIFSKLFTASLRLGCDSDLVVQQLFNPLTIQVVHWLTKPNSNTIGFELADICLRVIIEGLVQSDEIPLRDFSGVCLYEFFAWSIKQNNSDQTQNVIRNITAMSTHASFEYRQGSVLGFNKIYRQFREDSKLRNTYTFQLFRNFILGLSISSDMSEDSLLIRNTKQSISHLERILIKYASLFNVKIRSQDRPHPKDFDGNTLKNLVDWLLEYCASTKSICRKESIRLIKVFSKLAKVNQNSYDLGKIVNEFEIAKPGEILRFSDKILKNDAFNLSQSLCASGEYYSLLEEANYSSFNQLLNNESIFISKLESILNDPDKINQEFLICLSQMSFLARSSSISLEIKRKILDTTILVSKRISIKMKPLLKLWNNVWDSQAVDTEFEMKIRSHFQLNLNVDGNENELSKNVDWFLRISNDEEKFIEKILSSKEIKSICENIWDYIESKLYQKGSNNDLSSVQISQKLLKMLEKLLLLGLRLGYLDDNVERSAFSTIKVIKNDAIASLKQKVSKGDLFQQYFISALVECKKLLDFKTLKDQRSIIEVGYFVQKLLIFVKNNREQRAKYGTTIVQNISDIWPALSLNCETRNVSTIISGLASIDMKACRDSNTLVKWWSKEIQIQERIGLSEKAELFHFLPLFGLSNQKENVELVIEAIDNFVKEDISQKNINYSLEECYLTKIFLKIGSFYSSKPENIHVFEILTNFLARISLLTENSPCFNSFRKIMEGVLDEEKLKKEITFKRNIKGNQLVNRIFKVIKERLDDNFILMKFGLLPALSTLSSQEFKIFYEENIVDMLDMIKLNAKTVKDWVRKTIGFQLIEILSIKGQKDLLKKSQLNKIYMENYERFNDKPRPEEIKGNELLKYLVTMCQRFTSLPTPKQTDKDVKEANFKANCASYNAFVATIQVTQDEEKFLMILMEEKPDKKYLIWKNIIDCEAEINFPHLLQYNNNNERNRKMQAGSSASVVGVLEGSEEIPNFLKANKNLNTNKRVLANSSLACSAASFDFTSSFRVENCDFYNDIYNIARVDSKEKKINKDKDDDKIESTQLIFNHDCNQSIASTLKNMNKCSVVTKDDRGIPKWINIIISYLNNDRGEKNVKIFLVGAILNTSEKIFQSYSEIFFEPILRALVRGVFGYQLNHFVKDIIITLLGWTEVTRNLPSDRLIYSTLEFMVNNIQSDLPRVDVYKNSLSILQATVKQWVIGGNIENKLPYATIKRKLSDNQDLKAGVEICKSILRSDQLPYPVNDIFELIDRLNQGLKSPSKPFYTSTGETFGYLLSVLKKMEDQTILSRSLIVIKRKLEIQRETRLPPFLVMVSSIQKYYPGFFNEYKSPIYELLCDKKLKSEALLLMPEIFEEELRIVQDSTDLSKEKAEDTYTELVGRKVFDAPLCGINELKCGLKLFKLFLKNMPNYGEDKFMKLFNWIENAETCEDEFVRKDFAEILANIYETFGRKDPSNYREKLTKLAQRAEKIFIRLYKDESQEVEKVVNQFWEKNLQAGKKSPDLILELIELLAEEEDSLRIALDLIMKRCSSSPDFGKKIFDKPLEEGEFFEYQLDTSWRFKNASHAPLFAESISSSQNFAALPSTLKSSIMGGTLGTARLGMNLLKSTLASCKLQFSLTQENAKNSFDDSQANYPDLYENRFRSAESQEVLENGEMMDVDALSTADSSSLSSLPSSLSSLRKKFYDNSSSTSINFYASREINRQKAQMDKSIEQAKNKRVGVSLVRKYRIGEMPDIEIYFKDFLLTVLNITKADESTGKAFFVHLFTCLVKEMKNNGSNIENFIQNTRITLDRIFKKNSSGLNPNFAAALIEIATENNIPIEAHLISKIALNFDIQKVSILKFEEELLNHVESTDQPPSNKRAKTNNVDLGKNAERWIRMAELYKDLDNFDSIRNIFSKISNQGSNEKLVDKCEKAQNALHWENCGDYGNALMIYDGLCADEKEEESDDDLNVCMLKFYDDAIFKCLKYLSNWEDCYKRADDFNRGEMSTDTIYLEKYLPNKIKAGLEIIIRNDDEKEDSLFTKFQDFVSKLESNNEVNMHVLENHPIELSTIRATYEDWPSCITHLDSSFDSALKSFVNFNNISNIHKKGQILDIQRAAFLKDIVEWTKIHKEFEDKRDFNTFEEKTDNLITKWSRASTGQSISLYNCDILVALRQYFGTLMMSEKIDKITDYPNEKLKTNLGSFILKQNLWALNIAILNKNNDVSINYLTESKKIDPHDIQFMIETGRYLSTFTESKLWINVWTKGWKNLEKYCSNSTEVQSELFLSLLKHVKKNETLDDQECGQVMKTLHIADARRSQFLPNTIEKAVNFVKKSVLGDENDMVENELTNGNALMCFYNLLRYILMNFSNDNIDKKEIHKLMTMSLLRGMKSGNFEAAKLFPSCFPALEEYPEIHSIFTEITSCIGLWKFLPWLDQIIAHSKTPSIKPLLGKLIEKILDSYPQAFQLQYPDLLQRKNGSNICSSSYAKSLGSLVLPNILYEVNAMFHFDTKNSSGIFLKNLLEFEKCLNKKLENTEIYGSIHTEFVNEILSDVCSTIEKVKSKGIDSQSLVQSQEQDETSVKELKKDFLSKVIKLNDKMKKYERVKTIKLEDISPWLHNFHFTDWDEIEIPGLYNDFRHSAPLEEIHPKIVSFDKTLLLLDSKAKPIRLTMIANNGKKYRYLCKFGDDLRQDKRIQQLFRLANEIFKTDPNCSQRSLNVKTYSVIPMSKKFGLIQWVDKSVQMREFLFKKSDQGVLDQSKLKYHKWIHSNNKGFKDNDTGNIYGCVAKQKKSDVEFNFRNIVNSIPKGIFRDKVRAAAYGLEEYFSLRERMIRSYSTMCLIHWLLGIGDRHLGNCMLSLVDGEFLGIDFGYSFGTAITLIAVPELMPFRLTPQLETFLMPYGHFGLFKETMLFSWRALLQSANLISIVAEIFIKEPNFTFGKKIGFVNNVQIERQHPIEMLRDKLRGKNPLKLLHHELQFVAYKALVPNWIFVLEEGRKELFKDEYVDEDVMVDSLINLASDYNILGRTFVGWSSWV